MLTSSAMMLRRPAAAAAGRVVGRAIGGGLRLPQQQQQQQQQHMPAAVGCSSCRQTSTTSTKQASAAPAAAAEQPPLSYSERMAKTGRPISPHVTIYKFPPAALSSIVNRVTGVGLTVGLYGVGAVALGGGDVTALMESVGQAGLAGGVAKGVVVFPLVYHYLGAVRHAVWDFKPETLSDMKAADTGSYALLGTSVGAALVAAVL